MGENKPRIVQIRRGTTAEHENFKGKIGEVTMDTDAKTLRIHDGQTPGGIILARRDEIQNEGGGTSLPPECDVIIESEVTSKTWYRKYKSGWIEQGGQHAVSVGNNSVALLFDMLDLNYFIQVSNYAGNQGAVTLKIMNLSTEKNLVVYSSANSGIFWEVKGWMAT